MRMLVLGDARQPHLGRWVAALERAGAHVEAMSYEAPASPLPCVLHRLSAQGPGLLRAAFALGPAMEVAARFAHGCWRLPAERGVKV